MRRAAFLALSSSQPNRLGCRQAARSPYSGLRLGMPYDRAHARLSEIGQFKSEDEGQQVWRLRYDKHYQYLIIGFDRDRSVRYITVLARPNGQPVNYADVGNLADAAPPAERQSTLYWKANDRKGRFEYLAIAKGKDCHYLNRYAIKAVASRERRCKRERRQDLTNGLPSCTQRRVPR